MKKTVIVSHFALPYSGIASWTTRFSYLLKKENSNIDYVICPKKNLDKTIVQSKHYLVEEPKILRYKMEAFIKFYRFKVYWNALKKILSSEKELIVMIIDNPGLLKTVDYYARKEGVRSRIKILFFIHGYHYFMPPNELENFYGMIDDLIVLTRASYHFQLTQTHALPCEVTHIYNGVDSIKFQHVSASDKTILRQTLGLSENKIYLLWLSQDRSKKGLHIILKAWEKLIQDLPNIELLIIGTHNEIHGKQIRWLGRIPNDQLASYYQASDIYLFSTLCHEGHPMSLTEALKCGNVCIASNIDPVAEIMGTGSFGRLVDFPNMPQNWVKAISDELKKYENNSRINTYRKNIPDKIYDLEEWCKNIEKLVEKWKKRTL